MAVGLVLVLALALVGGVAWALRPTRTDGPTSPSQAWVAAERHARRVTVVAWCVLIPVPVLALLLVTPFLTGLGAGALLSVLPLLAGAAFLGVHLTGELTWPRPAGPLRRAPLVRRRVRDLAPHGLVALTATWSTLLVALLAVCAAAAGTGGRSLSYRSPGDFVSTASPFPGWFYGRGISIALVVVLAGCAAVLLLVARRAAVADTDPADDLALRGSSSHRVLAGVQLVVGATLAGCLFFAANCVRSVEPGWADAFGPGSASTVAGGAALVALGIGITSLVVAVRGVRTSLVRSGAVPADHPKVAA